MTRVLLLLFASIHSLTASTVIVCNCDEVLKLFTGNFEYKEKSHTIIYEGISADQHSILLKMGVWTREIGGGVTQFWIIRHDKSEDTYYAYLHDDSVRKNPIKYTGKWHTEKREFFFENSRDRKGQHFRLIAPTEKQPYPRVVEVYDKTKKP